ncbi:iron-containing alcohol dehydrogenase PsrA [Alcaligenes faecalis]|jgi:phosphonate metabolism-associated iron-containing alcohol dehydrogenase|uniref:iron-containing alcohol dehydrogenase PsrA n=1 Tax=Alcaligenes faecalis TaxID=511 RepID=UPI00122CD1FC|nr:iron-containing alcohol dehydrogenase PsrA [Alcaligenes faecalis]KAA1286067.1 iron-containing alcohol dehydrogenase [Alcaligenes faecalis]WHQ42523.1 iron-containing alcohol dehydrogenase [Alcaligenes faecalis]
MTKQFSNPVRTYFGPGSLKEISGLAVNKKVTLVTFPEARSLGLVAHIQGLLGESLVHIVEDVQPNPDVSYLKGVYETFWQTAGDSDIVLAVGGGSAIDTAKALIVGTRTGTFQELLDLLSTGKAFTPVASKALIAVPTTAGTGSEVTPWATIWDQQAQKKYSLHLEQTWPAVAIIDPELMLTVPEKVTVSTGLDALSHALESIWNVNANPISDTFAISAIEDILMYLPQLQMDLGNIHLRSKMALAALKAGMAFSNTKTALAHSISYEMTLRYGLPHGIACSFTLPYVLGLAWGCDPSRDQVFEQLFGPDREQAQERLRHFLQSVGVKTEFIDYGVQAQEQDDMIAYAMQGARGKNFIAA